MCRALLLLALALVPLAGPGGEWSGYLAGQLRWFPETNPPVYWHTDFSLAIEPEYYHAWDGGNQSLTLRPFLRLDQRDPSRTHADLRELLWIRAGDGWELRAGVGKEFWGVTESLHLVDIINQTDLVENPDGEQKLGQPMLKLSLERDWGIWDLFLLPGFRERTYPGRNGRLGPRPTVDTGAAVYASGAGGRRTDLALRWSHSLGDYDLGLAWFHGTGREPSLLPQIGPGGEASLIPLYEVIHQFSLDAQLTRGEWLWKLEAFHRSGQGDPFAAAVGGFEYTRVGVFETRADLGLLLEYLWDQRGDESLTAFQDDLFLGLRWTLNDLQNSNLLAGVILDPGSDARIFSIEAERRLGAAWTLGLQARIWSHIPAADPLAGLADDDYLELTLSRWF
jgi:hypothetical protein